MSTAVEMPELGESVTEGTITQWLKNVGDTVAVDEPLLEVSTDKVDTEIPSPVAGTLLKIYFNEDDTVDVGATIADIGDASESSGSPAPAAEPAASTPAPEPEPAAPAAPAETPAASSAPASGENIVMPELGESVTEGTVTQWLKNVGDSVTVDEPLLEVSTDKVDTEVPSPVAGTLLQIVANEDDTVDVGATIAVIGDASAQPAAAPSTPEPAASTAPSTPEPAPAATQPAAQVAPAQPEPAQSAQASQAPAQTADQASGDRPYVTPLVRKLAKDNNVELSTLTGTGVGGRIRKQDVLAAVGIAAPADAAAATTAGATAPVANAAAGSAASTKSVDPEKQALRGTTQKVNRIRSITASKTREALQQSAQLTQVHQADMSGIFALRKANKPAFLEKYGINLTFLPFFAKAAVEALVAHPNVNASYNPETKEMTYHEQVNLSIAVDTPAGLLSPTIRDAQDMSFPELAKAIVEIADRARNNKLSPSELSGATFTISNIGSEGALSDTPIAIPPQAAIMGTGRIVKEPVVITEDGQDAIAIRQMVLLPLTYDHQIVDGADAGRFMTTVTDRLQTANFQGDLGL